MKQELEHFLIKRFPEFFKKTSEEESFMHWGFECDDGWFNILYQACSLVEHHINSIESHNLFRLKTKEKIESGQTVDESWTIENVPEFKAAQIKEKFGTLRFYYNGGDEFINGVITSAQNSSSRTCEVCGNIGKLRSNGWMRTLCDAHTEKTIKVDIDKGLVVGDNIKALTNGAIKNLIIKETHEDYIMGKTYSSKYDMKKNKDVITEGNESYTIKIVKTDMHSYYDATVILE